MPGRIYGFISDSSQEGKPIGGLRIQVWDRDLLGEDDLLGETNTTVDGLYEFNFHNESWKKSIGIFEIGRPDIFITIDNQISNGKWVRLAQSEEFTNHDLNNDLRINLQISFGRLISKHTNFLPERDGFHFINSFIIKPDILGFDLGQWNMGFCGGMCAGALNRFRIGSGTPDDDSVPPGGSQLYKELMSRQIKAMSLKMLPKMLEWQASPEFSSSKRKPSIGERTRDEWITLKAELDYQNPTIIILIRTSGMLGNPTDNHQVLAIGYEFNPASMELVLSTYDPNLPDKAQSISMNVGLPGGSLDLVDSASEKTRGLFVNPVGDAAAE